MGSQRATHSLATEQQQQSFFMPDWMAHFRMFGALAPKFQKQLVVILTTKSKIPPLLISIYLRDEFHRCLKIIMWPFLQSRNVLGGVWANLGYAVCSAVSDSLRPPWTIPCQAPLSMEFSRQVTGVGCHFPTLGDLPEPRTEPTSLVSPALGVGSLPWCHPVIPKPRPLSPSDYRLAALQILSWNHQVFIPWLPLVSKYVCELDDARVFAGFCFGGLGGEGKSTFIL